VSTAHAKLQRREGIWILVDLDSTNGTFVDGDRVKGEAPLAPGATLRFGDVALVFEPTDDAAGVAKGGGTRMMEVMKPAPPSPPAAPPARPSPPPSKPRPAPAAAPPKSRPAPAPARPKARPPAAEQKKKGKGCGAGAAVLVLGLVAVAYWAFI